MSGHHDLLGDPSLALMFAFQVVYVIRAFRTAAYASAFLVARGYGPRALEVAFADVGVAFIVSSVATGEILGKLKIDLKLLVVGAALAFCMARDTIYIVPLPFTRILLLLAVASLCDAFLGAAIRTNVAAYETWDRTLSMVFFCRVRQLRPDQRRYRRGGSSELPRRGGTGLPRRRHVDMASHRLAPPPSPGDGRGP